MNKKTPTTKTIPHRPCHISLANCTSQRSTVKIVRPITNNRIVTIVIWVEGFKLPPDILRRAAVEAGSHVLTARATYTTCPIPSRTAQRMIYSGSSTQLLPLRSHIAQAHTPDVSIIGVLKVCRARKSMAFCSLVNTTSTSSSAATQPSSLHNR